MSAGGTGFVGSVVVEKLLRLCPDVARVFLLMRVKAGKSGAVPFIPAGAC